MMKKNFYRKLHTSVACIHLSILLPGSTFVDVGTQVVTTDQVYQSMECLTMKRSYNRNTGSCALYVSKYRWRVI